MKACTGQHKDDPDIMRKQVDRYMQAGYPEHHGLVETTVLLRWHTPRVAEFNAAWWTELTNGSLRDQLSFNYVAWKQRMAYAASAALGTRRHPKHFVFCL